MGVTIFTSRIILESLGITDYGVYNVVGGIAGSFGFFSSSMTSATQRYFSYGHGEGNIEKVREYFNVISVLYLFACGGILVIGGALGFWIVSRLNIPADLYWSGVVVFYTTLISLIITLFSSIFDSVLISRENLKLYAYVSIIEAGLKLGISYLLFLTPSKRLIVYALLLLSVTIITKGILWIYCLKKFEECRFDLKWEPSKMKGILSFMGWTGGSTIAWLINDQGTNIILNLFFGPVVNAARGVASQVNNAITNFSRNFYVALTPQIIKSYASGDVKGSISMMNNSSLFSYYLLWLIILPVIVRRDYILHLWLKEVPDYASIFLFWILLYSLVNVLITPQWVFIQAIGKLKAYSINSGLFMILPVVIGYLFYRFGYPPQTIFILSFIFRFMLVLATIINIKTLIDYHLTTYLIKVLLPLISVSFLSYFILQIINPYIEQNFGGLVLIVLISIIISFTLMILSLDKKNKNFLFNKLKPVLKIR